MSAVVATWLLSLLAGMPAGAVAIPLPRHAIVPNTENGDARGRCAIVQGMQLGFVAMTVDEGKTWRFIRRTPDQEAPGRWTKFYCDGDAFFAVNSAGVVGRPDGDAWKVLLTSAGPIESTYRGLESLGGALFLGTGKRTFTSSDRGATWRPWLAGVGALTTDGKTLFAGVGREVRRINPGTTDGRAVGKLPETVTALGFDGGTLYAGTATGVYRSRDGGADWTKVRAPPAPLPEEPSRFTFANGSVVVHFEGFPVKIIQPGDKWKDRDDCWAILPAAGGFWLRGAGSFNHVGNLDDKPRRTGWPDNPFPTVWAVGASGAKLVVAVQHIDGLFVSQDGGRQWQRLCEPIGYETAIANDGERLQLAPSLGWPRGPCTVPGFKTRVVQQLPEESCNGSLCVRWRDRRLLRTRDRGKTWDDMTDKLPLKVRGANITAVAAAGREILLGTHLTYPSDMGGSELWRSVDDGATFTRWDLGATVRSFVPGPDGWYVGTCFGGLWRVPYGTASARSP